MSYDKRYSESEIIRIRKAGRREGLLLVFAAYFFFIYVLPKLIEILP